MQSVDNYWCLYSNLSLFKIFLNYFNFISYRVSWIPKNSLFLISSYEIIKLWVKLIFRLSNKKNIYEF